MEEKLKTAEEKRKKAILCYFIMFATILCPVVLGFLGVLPFGPGSEEALYNFELVAVLTLVCIPMGIVTFNTMMRKANKENFPGWCNKYFQLILIRTASCLFSVFIGSYLYLIYEKETFIYYAAFGLIATIYVYPNKNELIKLLNGEEGK